jgi:hypothetical protein
MKKLAIVTSLFFSLTCFAQHFVVENIGHKNILYRGYENKIAIGQVGCEIEDFKIEAIHCELTTLAGAESENIYIVKPHSSAKKAVIRFVSGGQTIDSVEFDVQNLPAPSLYWGNNKSGANFSNSAALAMKYAPEVTLTANFEIIGWKCITQNKQFEDSGSILSPQFIDFTKTMKTGETIQIQVKIKNADGSTRFATGTWLKG